MITAAGLRPLPRDSRDYSHDKAFGTLGAIDIPFKDFVVCEPLEIKDQGDSDLCAAFSSVSASEDQEGVILSPEWQFAMAKKLEGKHATWGLDLRTAMRSFAKSGSIKVKDAPYSLKNERRDFIANWENWPAELDEKAVDHLKKSFFTVDGPSDLFNNMRAMLWQHKDHKRTIVTGATWRHEWTNAPGGIIPKQYGKGAFGHAFKIYGQKIINGEMYLVAQLSNGKKLGDNGIFYFPREVVNREFTYGAYMFIDADAETIARVKAQYSLMMKLIDALQTYLQLLKIKLGAWL